MTKRLVVASLLAVAAGCSKAPPPPAPSSALVSTRMPQQGRMPVTIVAFGSARPSKSGMQTLSVNQPGQVVRILVTGGVRVHTGQPILTFAISPGARAGFEQAATQLRLARTQRDTTARLLAQQLATRDQLAQADKSVADAQAALSGLAVDGAGEAVQTVRAPFDGTIGTLAVAPGDRMQAGATLATMIRNDGLVITVGVPDAKANGVAPGQSATIEATDGSGTIDGRVLRVDAALDPQTRLVDVDVAFPSQSLRSGAGATVTITTRIATGWIVPHAAVVTADGPTHVFQVSAGKAHAVPVTVVQPSSKDDLVDGPFEAALPVIVDGAYQVADGDTVRTSAR